MVSWTDRTWRANASGTPLRRRRLHPRAARPRRRTQRLPTPRRRPVASPVRMGLRQVSTPTRPCRGQVWLSPIVRSTRRHERRRCGCVGCSAAIVPSSRWVTRSMTTTRPITPTPHPQPASFHRARREPIAASPRWVVWGPSRHRGTRYSGRGRPSFPHSPVGSAHDVRATPPFGGSPFRVRIPRYTDRPGTAGPAGACSRRWRRIGGVRRWFIGTRPCARRCASPRGGTALIAVVARAEAAGPGVGAMAGPPDSATTSVTDSTVVASSDRGRVGVRGLPGPHRTRSNRAGPHRVGAHCTESLIRFACARWSVIDWATPSRRARTSTMRASEAAQMQRTQRGHPTARPARRQRPL